VLFFSDWAFLNLLIPDLSDLDQVFWTVERFVRFHVLARYQTYLVLCHDRLLDSSSTPFVRFRLSLQGKKQALVHFLVRAPRNLTMQNRWYLFCSVLTEVMQCCSEKVQQLDSKSAFQTVATSMTSCQPKETVKLLDF